jgi:hypothetical protein
VPASLPFDVLHYSVEGNEDGSVQIDTEFRLRNGFRTPQHEALEGLFQAEEGEVEKAFVAAYDAATEKYSVDGMYDEETIRREDFVEEGGELVAKIDSVSITVNEETEKEIYINLRYLEACDAEEAAQLLEEETTNE